MQKLASIRNLQRLGFSLDEIKDLYDESEHVPSIVQIDDKIRSTEAQIAQLEMRLRRLLLLRDSRKEIKTMKNSPSSRCPKSSSPATVKPSPTMQPSDRSATRR